MPNHHPTPGAEDIDEQAARRSIRVTMIVMFGAFPLFAVLGVLVFRQIANEPARVSESVPAWEIAILVAVLGAVLAATVWWVRRQYRRPVYRRVMQFGWQRRRRVIRDLRRGRPLSTEDMPVAAATVELMRAQRRWLLPIFGMMPVNFLFQGLVQKGLLRWLDFGLVAFWLLYLPIFLRQQRQITRNYERQSAATLDNHQGAASSS